MDGKVVQRNADELVLHYERSLVAGETQHAANIKTAHSDLLSRFEAVDERLARKS
jgi:hypothetical protein